MPITIETTMGRPVPDLQSISLALDTDQPTNYEAIERVCGEY